MTNLDLQEVISSNALIVHFMVCVVSVATALIFDESEADVFVSHEAKGKRVARLTVDWKHFVELGCRSAPSVHSCVRG